MQFPSPDSRTLPDRIQCRSVPGSEHPSATQAKIVGSLVGLAVGDALGASVEFRPRQYLIEHPVTDMQSGGTWGLQAGQWTDDTSMALCLASSLLTRHDFNPYDQMVRYKWWYKKGFLSSTGECFDIGSTTRTSLDEFCRRQNILKQHFRLTNDADVDNLPLTKVRSVKNFSEYCGSKEAAGNGALMRLAPVPLFYFRQPQHAVELAGESALLTHGDRKAVDACRYYAALIVAAVNGESKDELLNDRFYEKHQTWFGSGNLHPDVLKIARGSYKRKGGYAEGIRGKGYVLESLEASLWAFWSDENSFEQGALNAVSLGDDTDTTAAIYGQLAGACYGISAIPSRWAQQLYASNLIINIGEWLYFEGSQTQNNTAQQQPQKQPTPQHRDQPRMPGSQPNQNYGAHSSTQHQQQKQTTPQQYNQPRMPGSQPNQNYGAHSSTQHQQQKQTTPQQYNQPRMPAPQLNQNHGTNPFTQQIPSTTAPDRMGYGRPMQQMSQQTRTQAPFQSHTTVNPNNTYINGRKVKPKLDPSKMPTAGVPSGFQNK